jgi:hypothetical protein
MTSGGSDKPDEEEEEETVVVVSEAIGKEAKTEALRVIG